MIAVAKRTPQAREIAIGTTKKVDGFAVTIKGTRPIKVVAEVRTIGLLYQCKSKGVPLLLLNARLSSKSLDRYLLFRNFTSKMLVKFEMICAQSEADRKNFEKLTRANIDVIGNTKFDFPTSKKKLSLSKALKKSLIFQIKFC